MIFHLFDANISHHVPLMIECVLKNANETNAFGTKEHFFFLRLSDNLKVRKNRVGLDRRIYETLFDNFNTKNYKYILNSLKLVGNLYNLSKDDQLIIHDNQSLFGRVQLFWFFFIDYGSKLSKENFNYFMGCSRKKEEK
jgi:hypothetical protein